MMKSNYPLVSMVFFTTIAIVLISDISSVSGQCLQNKYGPDCSYDCHCALNVTCQPEAGCGEGCAAGWDGPSCQRQNVALERPTNQSSNYEEKYTSDLAVDGQVGHILEETRCSHTAPMPGTHFWLVTLNETYWINNFTIYNRDGYRNRLNNFILSVGNASQNYETCYHDNTPWNQNPGAIITRQCTGGPVSGDRIRITTPSGVVLTLCEVLVYVCSVGWYGNMCGRRCVTTTACSKCDVTGTRCAECVAGRMGEHCLIDCENGTYGLNCSGRCGPCADGPTVCETSSGICPERPGLPRCMPGYFTEKCDTECKGGTWGEDCQKSCGNCYNGTACNKTHGECPVTEGNPRCSAGYVPTSKKCDTQDGLWGGNCSRLCGSAEACDSRNGKCRTGCRDGLIACENGTYGLNCSGRCGPCADGPTVCETSSGICPERPGLPRCMPGYFTEKCDTECKGGTWGEDCQKSCGNCYNGTACNKTHGECPVTEGNPRCSAGYVPTSKKCDTRTYGLNCSGRCGSCADGPTVCETSSGICPERPGLPRCMPGYFTEKCDTECNGGTWGEDCQKSCGNCYNGTACNKTHGECPVTEGNPRCSADYVPTSKKCDTSSFRSNDQRLSMIGAIVGGILGVLVFCVVAVAAVILYRRRRSPTKDAQSTHSLSVRTGGEVQLEVEDDQSNGGYETDHEEDLVSQETPAATYENEVSTSVPVEEFWEHVQNKIASGGFKTDFAKFPAGLHAKHEVADLPHNKLKSRYTNLVAYDHSRVVLNLQGPNDKSDYINACYINGYKEPKKFIASQGPTDLIIYDFMRMLWEQDVGKVVMVTNLSESTKKKCNQYWPNEGSTLFDTIGVTLLDEEFYANYTIRTLELNNTKEKNKTRILKQFHFKAWPDHGVPADATELLDFRDKVLKYGSNLAGPIVVHCSAGIGRTGTFIALDYLINQAKEEGVVDAPACVMTLRQQRVNMVQTKEQYAFLLEALAEALKLSDSSVPSVDFAAVYSDLCTVDPESGQSKMAKQFEVLQELSQPADKMKMESARHPDNISKNRYNWFLAADNSRPYLSTPVSGCNDYINAVFLPGYKRKKGFIITQTPLPNTVVDFWRLVYDHGVSTVIMLDRVNTGNKSVGIYWTDEDAVFGPFKVEVTDVEKADGFSSWTYRLTHKDKKAAQPVNHFRCSFWSNKPTLTTIPALLAVLQSAEIWQGKTGGGPVLVHCRDGVTTSGLFCVAWSVLERLKVDHNINILQTIKQMRNNRPEIITDLDQLNFIYQVVLSYLDKFQTYANFS